MFHLYSQTSKPHKVHHWQPRNLSSSSSECVRFGGKPSHSGQYGREIRDFIRGCDSRFRTATEPAGATNWQEPRSAFLREGTGDESERIHKLGRRNKFEVFSPLNGWKCIRNFEMHLWQFRNIVPRLFHLTAPAPEGWQFRCPGCVLSHALSLTGLVLLFRQQDNSLFKVWFKQDDTFLLPKACMYFEISRFGHSTHFPASYQCCEMVLVI